LQGFSKAAKSRFGLGCFRRATELDKSPGNRGFLLERMMGLEPTTFCMASRRSSQLSYIRERQPV
jgi:hypothetical protein